MMYKKLHQIDKGEGKNCGEYCALSFRTHFSVTFQQLCTFFIVLICTLYSFDWTAKRYFNKFAECPIQNSFTDYVFGAAFCLVFFVWLIIFLSSLASDESVLRYQMRDYLGDRYVNEPVANRRRNKDQGWWWFYFHVTFVHTVYCFFFPF